MKLRISKYLFLLMMAVFALSSCSEDDNTVDEYANWQERNEQAFDDTLAYAQSADCCRQHRMEGDSQMVAPEPDT